jgi:hypothetical protein
MRVIPALLALFILVIACNNDKKVVVKGEDGSTTTVDMNAASNAATDMEKKMEELKKLPPLSVDELKAMLPEQLAGMPRTDYNAMTNMGVSMATAKYANEEGSDVDLVIYDGAGEAGAGIYSLHYWTKMNMQSEGSYGYTKTIDFMGGKAVESFDKSSNQYTLTVTPNERLLVILSGRNTTAEALRDAAKGLNIK